MVRTYLDANVILNALESNEAISAIALEIIEWFECHGCPAYCRCP
jgi:hypothetical protein